MRQKARLEGKPMRYDGRWRDRDPYRGAPRRCARHPPPRPPRGRDGHRRQGAGQGRLRQQGSRRSRAPALRRQSDLYAGGRRRRSRHGRDSRHPRRRPSDQRRASDPDLSGARLGRPGLGAYPAHPWAGRREALQAPRGARRRRLSRDGLSARGAAQLSRAPRLEPGRQGVLHRPTSSSPPSICRRSADRPRASTSPSSRT